MTELKKLAKRYEKVLDKLDALNEEAFQLEVEMNYERNKEGKSGGVGDDR